MVRHVGQKLHKLIYGLAEPSDDRELSDLYNKLLRTFSQHAIDTEKGRDDFMMAIAFDVVDSLSIPSRGVDQVCDLIAALFDYEDFLILPPIDLSDKRTTAEKWDLKDELKELRVDGILLGHTLAVFGRNIVFNLNRWKDPQEVRYETKQ